MLIIKSQRLFQALELAVSGSHTPASATLSKKVALGDAANGIQKQSFVFLLSVVKTKL